MKSSLNILILLVLVSHSFAYAQKGYLGKTKSFNFGLSTNFSFTEFDGADYKIKIDDNRQVILPKIDLGYSIQKKRTIVDFEARYQMLPNIIQNDLYGEANTVQEIYITDTTKMRSNVYRVGIALKSFNHVAPIGLYLRYGIGLNVLTTKSLARKTTEAYLYSQDIWENKDEYTSYSGISVITDVSISVGKIIPLSRKLNLNFGIQTNFPLARFKFDDSTPGTLVNPIFRKWLLGRSLFARNIFEAYVKIHLFH